VKIFSCSACDGVLFFENTHCTGCKRVVAYLPDQTAASSLDPMPKDGGDAADLFVSTLPAARKRRYRLCRNYTEHGVCNWAIPADDANAFCLSCRLTTVIPDLSQSGTKGAWQRLENAKRRLLYTLFALSLPVQSKLERPEDGLAFAFKQDEDGGMTKVLTGHDRGLITINLREADSSVREKTREELGEAYRTLLGHFRHESGHYYWTRLIQTSRRIEPFRRMFGDERLDYDKAVQHHYAQGPSPDWPVRFVSAYASLHPWEDWAETWAHYLHMVDTLETARSHGVALRPTGVKSVVSRMKMTVRALDFDDFRDLISAWVPLTLAVNNLNRSMGLPDAYPFVLCGDAIAKLQFVHDVVEESAALRSTLPSGAVGVGA